ncbi:MAG: hypothetical protein ABEJ56_00575 [Candidatus Nanohaloarchaea archaeon]
MEIESELPQDFEELPDEEKVSELEEVLERLDSGTDSGALKKRMVEELIRHYRA